MAMGDEHERWFPCVNWSAWAGVQPKSKFWNEERRRVGRTGVTEQGKILARYGESTSEGRLSNALTAWRWLHGCGKVHITVRACKAFVWM